MVKPEHDARREDDGADQFDLLNFRRWQTERRPRLRRGVYLLPSLFTMGNMFCGYLCILYAIRGEFAVAAPFIGVAVVLDVLDGRIARMTGTATAFGVEFDSLADVISFGIAPAVLTFMWGLQPLQRLGWAAGFIYLSAAALRLARFNIQSIKSTDKRHFVGMPSPAAAAVPASTVFFYPGGLQDPRWAFIALALMVVPALLMVSTIRFNSFKTIDTQKRRSYKVLALVALVIAVIYFHPSIVLLGLAYSYLLVGLAGAVWARFRRRPAAPPSAGGRRRQNGPGPRNLHAHHRPAPRRAVDGNRAAVELHVPLGDGEAQAGADRLRGEIGFEDAIESGAIHAHAAVPDRHDNRAPIG
jgi:CDP-diacylglycerol--serine O-phosphatidyltransferase